MQRHDIVPDVITHSTVISACEKDPERQQAFRPLRPCSRGGISGAEAAVQLNGADRRCRAEGAGSSRQARRLLLRRRALSRRCFALRVSCAVRRASFQWQRWHQLGELRGRRLRCLGLPEFPCHTNSLVVLFCEVTDRKASPLDDESVDASRVMTDMKASPLYDEPVVAGRAVAPRVLKSILRQAEASVENPERFAV